MDNTARSASSETLTAAQPTHGALAPPHHRARRPRTGSSAETPRPGGWWALSSDAVATRLASGLDGLSSAEAAARLQTYGSNEVERRRPPTPARVLARQLRSPLLLLLAFAAIVSALTGEWTDATIVLFILASSVGIGFAREYRAERAAEALRSRLRTRVNAIRDGRAAAVPIEEIVPGDVVLLAAGSLVPGDALILEAAELYVNQAILTGESFPVEKRPGPVAPDAALGERSNVVFLGTNVRSGTARCLVVETGPSTQCGFIAHRLALRPPATEFEQGLRRFGSLLTVSMLVFVLLVFLAHIARGRPAIETLLFSVALAVGLAPELLPAILSINLARDAQMMAKRGVLVRRLQAIENLGSMDVLCTDKTGTLTEELVELAGAFDATGVPSPSVLELAARNAALETGITTPLDDALVRNARPDLSRVRKLGEIPFDSVRKRVSIIIDGPGGAQLVMKGAFRNVLEACTTIAGGTTLDATGRAEVERRFAEWSEQGIRVLAVASAGVMHDGPFVRADEHNCTFQGFLTFVERPKQGARRAISDLAALGVSVKLVTGDARLVAQHLAATVGLRADRVLTGRQIDEIQPEALWQAAERTDLFVEVDPDQKERILAALRKMGHVVGFLGDGVNDAPAMHAADTSISVDDAVDVAREAADFVLLKPDLDVIRGGIEEGRKTFANTLKYLLMTMSANLGNMLSMAAASLFLPFLPLLARQILLNNLLSDVPAIGIADDGVDPELVALPHRWEMKFISRFMVEFGVLSSLFDLLTFALLLGVFHAAPELFRTTWFVESLLTQLVIVLVVRTRRPFFRSRPGRLLLRLTMLLIPLALAIPYLPASRLLGFVPLTPALMAAVCGIAVLYVAATELMKRWFYRRTA